MCLYPAIVLYYFRYILACIVCHGRRLPSLHSNQSAVKLWTIDTTYNATISLNKCSCHNIKVNQSGVINKTNSNHNYLYVRKPTINHNDDKFRLGKSQVKHWLKCVCFEYQHCIFYKGFHKTFPLMYTHQSQNSKRCDFQSTLIPMYQKLPYTDIE